MEQANGDEAKIVFTEGDEVRILHGKVVSMNEFWIVVDRLDGKKYIRTANVTSISFPARAKIPGDDSQ